MKTILYTCIAAVVALSVNAAELDRAASAMAGMEASFTHHFTPKGFKNSQTESGSVTFGTLPKMRWSYSKPEEKVFVFDGGTSWFYVPADKQVIVSEVSDARRRELPFLLLGDAAARDRVFVVREKSAKGAITTTLQAKDKASMIPAVTITTDPSSHLIRRIDYADRNGNRTSFDFSGYRRSSAGAGAFQFSPPAGVQVVRGE